MYYGMNKIYEHEYLPIFRVSLAVMHNAKVALIKILCFYEYTTYCIYKETNMKDMIYNIHV